MKDWSKDPQAKRWIEGVLTDMVPKMRGSAFVLSLMPSEKEGPGEAKFWVELGAAIMMDKPILLFAEPGRSIPKKLRAVADEIIFGYPDDPDVGRKIKEYVTRYAGGAS